MKKILKITYPIVLLMIALIPTYNASNPKWQQVENNTQALTYLNGAVLHRYIADYNFDYERSNGYVHNYDYPQYYEDAYNVCKMLPVIDDSITNYHDTAYLILEYSDNREQCSQYVLNYEEMLTLEGGIE